MDSSFWIWVCDSDSSFFRGTRYRNSGGAPFDDNGGNRRLYSRNPRFESSGNRHT